MLGSALAQCMARPSTGNEASSVSAKYDCQMAILKALLVVTSTKNKYARMLAHQHNKALMTLVKDIAARPGQLLQADPVRASSAITLESLAQEISKVVASALASSSSRSSR